MSRKLKLLPDEFAETSLTQDQWDIVSRLSENMSVLREITELRNEWTGREYPGVFQLTWDTDEGQFRVGFEQSDGSLVEGFFCDPMDLEWNFFGEGKKVIGVREHYWFSFRSVPEVSPVN